MTPERWQRVKEVLEAVWDLDGPARAAFLDKACAGDPELRSRVERLLISDRDAGQFLVTPAIAQVGAFAGEATAATAVDPDESSRRIGPYRILREVGCGGMGTVYVAERADGQFRKTVAIKVVRSGLDTEEVLRRFRVERQVEAVLDHPNIARLMDGGTTGDGRPYLVMEYVDGVRIDTWCDSRKLPVRDRIRLFQQVCAAVQYAHDKQIIHRDIKPGNILVAADGTPKLLDFGIAKVLDPGLADSAETTLGPGPMTPEYASPEQVRGERVGPASDIYALGVVLYNLLTGRLPHSFQGRDLGQVARVICHEEPVKPSVAVGRADSRSGPRDSVETVSVARGESPTSLRRQLSGDLDKIVLKALRKEPERRYSTVAQLSSDLDRFLHDLPVLARPDSLTYAGRKFLKRNRVPAVAAVLAAVLVLALVAGIARLNRPQAEVEDGIRSIAVLPLENLSGDPSQEYFADGMTDALIGELSRIPGLRVISRTSVMTYKNARRKMPDIARSLGVQTIAEGSVMRSANRVRIAVRLVDAPRERPMWSGSYQGEMRDVLGLQSQVAEAITREIDVTLAAPGKARGIRNRQVNLDAYDAYLKGRHYYLAEFTQQSTEKAISYFEQAISLDPTYAPAYAGLASCYYLLSNIYYPPREMMPKAKAAALKAIEMDDTVGEAHAVAALVRALYDFDHDEAEKGFRRALEVNPSNAEAHLWYGVYLISMGRVDDAVAQAKISAKLDPVSPGANAYIGFLLYLGRRYNDAIRHLEPIAAKYPNYHHPHALLALCYEQNRDYAKATAEMERAYRLDQEPEALAQLGHIYAMAGRRADARAVIQKLVELSRKRYVSVYSIGLVYAGLGERDEAFRWFGKVAEDRSEWFAQINVDPRLDNLHSDPRFTALLRAVGLAR